MKPSCEAMYRRLMLTAEPHDLPAFDHLCSIVVANAYLLQP